VSTYICHYPCSVLSTDIYESSQHWKSLNTQTLLLGLYAKYCTLFVHVLNRSATGGEATYQGGGVPNLDFLKQGDVQLQSLQCWKLCNCAVWHSRSEWVEFNALPDTILVISEAECHSRRFDISTYAISINELLKVIRPTWPIFIYLIWTSCTHYT